MDDIIVQKINDVFVVAYKAENDDDDERTCLGQGETEAEALKVALRCALNNSSELLEICDQIARLCGFGSCNVDNVRKYITIPDIALESGGDLYQSDFDALCFSVKHGQWVPLFR